MEIGIRNINKSITISEVAKSILLVFELKFNIIQKINRKQLLLQVLQPVPPLTQLVKHVGFF